MSQWLFLRYLNAALFATAMVGVASAQGAAKPIMSLLVDETQAARKIAFVHEEIRVHGGALTLAYPLRIPGEHGPTGRIQQLAALRIRSGNAPLPWMRDPVEIATIHIEVPANTDSISVDFDILVENTISDHQLLLAWNTVVLYPRGIDKTKLMIQPSVLLPSTWKQASSLEVTAESGSRLNFAPISLERLIDSPMLAGEFLRIIPLPSSWPAELDVTGDSQAALDKTDDAHAVDLFTKLVDQDRAMFGFRHWQKMPKARLGASTAWSTRTRHTMRSAMPAFQRKANWKNSAFRYSRTNNPTPGVENIGVRRSYMPRLIIKVLSRPHYCGFMRA